MSNNNENNNIEIKNTSTNINSNYSLSESNTSTSPSQLINLNSSTPSNLLNTPSTSLGTSTQSTVPTNTISSISSTTIPTPTPINRNEMNSDLNPLRNISRVTNSGEIARPPIPVKIFPSRSNIDNNINNTTTHTNTTTNPNINNNNNNNNNPNSNHLSSMKLPAIPIGPFQLTPQIASSLKIPYPGGGGTIIPQLMIEFINISVIRSTSGIGSLESSSIGLPPCEVVLTNQLQNPADAIVAYPNQPIIWQGREDGPERVSALNNLKSSVWKHFTSTISQQLQPSHQQNQQTNTMDSQNNNNNNNNNNVNGQTNMHSNLLPNANQILSKIRPMPQYTPRPIHQANPAPGSLPLPLPVPILPNGQYAHVSNNTVNQRRYTFSTPVQISFPGMNNTNQSQSSRGRQWDQISTGLTQPYPRFGQLTTQQQQQFQQHQQQQSQGLMTTNPISTQYTNISNQFYNGSPQNSIVQMQQPSQSSQSQSTQLQTQIPNQVNGNHSLQQQQQQQQQALAVQHQQQALAVQHHLHQQNQQLLQQQQQQHLHQQHQQLLQQQQQQILQQQQQQQQNQQLLLQQQQLQQQQLQQQQQQLQLQQQQQQQQQQLIADIKLESSKEQNSDLSNYQGRNSINSSNSTTKYTPIQNNHSHTNQNRTNNSISQHNGIINQTSGSNSSKKSSTIVSNLTPSNKRILDDLKDSISLTSNQPDGINTPDTENYVELKKLKQDYLEFSKYPTTLESAVAVLEDSPLSWDQQIEAGRSQQPSMSEYRQLSTQLLHIISIKEAEKANRPSTITETQNNATITNSSIIVSNKGTTSQPTTRQSTALAASTLAASKKNSKGKKEKEYAEEWVQCDSCSRWRLLPAPYDPLYPKELPDKWICTMNTWNTSQALCSVPEETTTHSEVNAQRSLKLRVWVRRLRSADRYEMITSRSNYDETKGYGEVDWIRCSNPNCGKWRACLRSMDGKKLRKKYPIWYCWMNSWDEARSSCAAPQEGTIVHSFAEKFNQQPGDDDDDWNIVEEEDDDSGMASGDGLTLQGISSRGRIVRSRWNSRRSRR